MERRQSLEVHLWPSGRVAVWVPVQLSGFAPRGSPVRVSVGGVLTGPAYILKNTAQLLEGPCVLFSTDAKE